MSAKLYGKTTELAISENPLYQKELHSLLLAITLTMTFFFGLNLADGWYGFLFAVTMVALQAGALLYLPGKAKQAKKLEHFWEAGFYVACILVVLLMSVTATVATLSNADDIAEIKSLERETLQRAVDGYLEHGFVTKAMALKEQMPALDESKPTDLQSAAISLSNVIGVDSNAITSGFIVLLALLLDLFTIMLNPKKESQHYAVDVKNEPEEKNNEGVQTDIFSDKKQLSSDVELILGALQDGVIDKPSVRKIRTILNCGQEKAIDLARMCRQLDLALPKE